MLRYALRRLLAAVPLLLAVLTLTFVLVETAPGDPADLLIGDRPVSPEVRARIAAAYGFDRPAPERYVRWLSAFALRGEWGWSVARGRPARDAVAAALPATLLLSGTALLLQCVLGVGWGALMARARGGSGDRWAGLLAALLYALPAFWLGMMAILALAVKLPLFPASSMHSVGADAWPAWRRALDLAHHLVLPAAVLGVSSAAGMARFVRAGLLGTVGEAFVRAARARGVGGGRLFGVHALRGALVPIVNLAGLSLPALVSGSLAVEFVFAWPGMGRLFYDALVARDTAVVLALTALTAALVIAGSLLADLAMAALDPRVRLGRPGGTAA